MSWSVSKCCLMEFICALYRYWAVASFDYACGHNWGGQGCPPANWFTFVVSNKTIKQRCLTEKPPQAQQQVPSWQLSPTPLIPPFQCSFCSKTVLLYNVFNAQEPGTKTGFEFLRFGSVSGLCSLCMPAHTERVGFGLYVRECLHLMYKSATCFFSCRNDSCGCFFWWADQCACRCDILTWEELLRIADLRVREGLSLLHLVPAAREHHQPQPCILLIWLLEIPFLAPSAGLTRCQRRPYTDSQCYCPISAGPHRTIQYW